MREKWKNFAAVCLFLIVATVMAYWPVTSCDFVDYDDNEYVYENPRVLEGLSYAGWCYAWKTFDCTNWHPLTWLSLELDASLWGRNPAGYHATNLVLHTINCLLLFVALYRLTNSVRRSGCVAAFFALHPLHVESVAWISERKDVLSTFFLLLTVLAYVRYATRPSAIRYLLVMALFSLGLLAKPMLVTLPILLLSLDWWPLGRIAGSCSAGRDDRFPLQSFKWLFCEKLPLISLAFGDGLATIIAQNVPMKSMDDVVFTTRLANLFHAYFWYLQKTFVPTNLTVFYPHPDRDLPVLDFAVGLICFFSISAWAVRQRKVRPHLLFGWAWFVISLLPVIGLVQVGYQAFADRYSYIPHMGLFISIVWELHARMTSTRMGRIVCGAIYLIALVACGMTTHRQLYYWKNSEALWIHAIDVNPNSGVACAHLAEIRLAEGKYDEALALTERGMRVKRSGRVAGGYCAWALALNGLNRPDEAEQKFREALKHDPDHEMSLDELAKLLQKKGRYAEAAPYLERHQRFLLKKAQSKPDTAAAQLDLGISQARQGHLRQAITHFEKAVQLAPELAPARFNLAYTQKQLKLYKDAKANLLRVIELAPDMAIAHFQLAKILEDERDFSGAKEHFAEALRLNPTDVETRQCLDRLSKP
jgi:Tfp pilus assembly protein PilF